MSKSSRENSVSKKHGSEFPEVVDLVTEDPKTNTTVLIIVETEPWNQSDERLRHLQNKINNYLSYGLDGQLERDFPEAPNDNLRIQIDSEHLPDEKTAAFLVKAKEAVANHGVELRINIYTWQDAGLRSGISVVKPHYLHFYRPRATRRRWTPPDLVQC